MAKNFGQKMMALQLGMLILGVLMFVGGYMLKKSIAEKRHSEAVLEIEQAQIDNKSTADDAPQQ